MSKFPQVAIAIPNYLLNCVREIRRRVNTIAADVWPTECGFRLRRPQEKKNSV